MGGATDALIRAGEEAKKGSSDWKSMVDKLHVRHREACESLIEGASKEAVLTEIEEGMSYIRSICEGFSCFTNSRTTPATHL